MKIITAVVNNPIFIEIQYHSLKKYFKGHYEFIVFNDAKNFPDYTNGNDVTIKTQIEDICNKLNIVCINIPNEQHKMQTCASIRCADSMNYMLQYQKSNPEQYLLIDSDMFLIDYFDINKYSEYDCAVVPQCRDYNNYFWNGIYYFDMTKMKNIELLNWECDNFDVGGMMIEWLHIQLNNESIQNIVDKIYTEHISNYKNIYFIKHLWSCSWDITSLPKNIEENIDNKKLIDFIQNDPRNKDGKFFCEIYDNTFLHYRSGGNWNNEGIDFHKNLSEKLKSCFL